MQKFPKRLLAAGVGVAVFAATAGGAIAKPPTGQYADFAQCPVNVPNLTSCLYSKTTGGNFQLPKLTVPITNPVIFQGGYKQDPNTGAESFYPAANGQTLSNSPQNVPGGLTGLTPPSLFPPFLQGLVNAAINTANGVTATAQLVGPANFSLNSYLDGTKPSVILPVRFKLDNPFLGPSCYIGSASNPVNLRLTTGTTHPPAGTAPLTGSPGTIDGNADGTILFANGNKLVDNTFPVPGASGCGYGIFAPFVDPIVNTRAGIPAAAGKSSATFTGSAKLANAQAVKANEQ